MLHSACEVKFCPSPSYYPHYLPYCVVNSHFTQVVPGVGTENTVVACSKARDWPTQRSILASPEMKLLVANIPLPTNSLFGESLVVTIHASFDPLQCPSLLDPSLRYFLPLTYILLKSLLELSP
ncbi:unnamed protein product, partial [Owenia fusiformis]